MINLDEWSDYTASIRRVRCVEHHVKNGQPPRLLIVGAKLALEKKVFVAEDSDYVVGLIGEKALNSASH